MRTSVAVGSAADGQVPDGKTRSMGVAWFALGLFVFAVVVGRMSQRLSREQRARRQAWEEWMGDDEDEE